MAEVLQCIYKWFCGDLDLFYDKVNIGRQCIGMGKTFKKSFEVKILQKMGIGLNINDSEKENGPKGSYAHTPGQYTCLLYD